MNKETIADIIEWDIENWSKSLKFWEEKIDLENRKYHCLELGGYRGGLSLWLALKGHKVICSDVKSPEKRAKEIIYKHNCGENISYQTIDATNIPYTETFDLIVFKSILGGITRNGKDELINKTINQIYNSLKPGGHVLFAENMEATLAHRFLRQKFIRWGNQWNYLKYNEIEEIFAPFKNLQYKTVGFTGTFGRTETQRKLLGKFDSAVDKLIPKNWKYILIGVAEK